MQQYWDTIGIDATTDAVAIKRAYALKLKVTRPDDDAQAYQRLREAYDWCLGYVRWSREEAEYEAAQQAANNQATEDVITTPAASEIVEAPIAETHKAQTETQHKQAPLEALSASHEAENNSTKTNSYDNPAEESPQWFHPAELARSLTEHWQTNGDQALLNALPALPQQLDNVPLSLRSDATFYFADLVTTHDALPNDFVAALANYFGWGQDFRVEQILGTERAEKLRQRLSQDFITPIRDEETLKQYEDVFTLERLLNDAKQKKTSGFKAYLYSLLAHPLLGERIASTPPRKMVALGVATSSFEHLGTAAKFSIWMRTALILLGLSFFEINTSPPHTAITWLWRLILLAMFGTVLLSLLPIFAALIRSSQNAWSNSHKRNLWLNKQRNASLSAQWAGLCFTISLAVCGASWMHEKADWFFAYPWAFLGWCILMVVGSICAWPSDRPWETVMLPLLLTTWLSLNPLLENFGGSPAAFSLAALWLLISQHFLIHKTDYILAAYRAPWQFYQPAHWWGWLWLVIAFKFVGAFILLVLVTTLPLSLMVLSIFFAYRLPLAGIGIAFAALLFIANKTESNWILLPASFLAALGLASLQYFCTKLSRIAWFQKSI